VSSFETKTEQERAELVDVLNGAAGYFRSELAKRHSMRTTPKPRFHYDEVIERGPRMESLIEKAVRSDAEHHHPDEDATDRRGEGNG
jgi:ribosome-binding factor A